MCSYQMLSDAFKNEIYKFDNERVLPAWDGLISRQQGELAQKGVPTMFVTSDVQDRAVRAPLYLHLQPLMVSFQDATTGYWCIGEHRRLGK